MAQWRFKGIQQKIKVMITSAALLSELQDKLEPLEEEKSFCALVGFDGFVDKIQKAIKEKRPDESIYFSSIREFSEHIAKLAGKSGQVELVTKKIKMGGNAPILSHALGNAGIKSYCVGALGLNDLQAVFKNIHPACQPVSINIPGQSSAIEFDDGKIILSELSVFNQYDWEYVKDRAGLEKLRRFAGECQLMAFVDWVNLPHATSIWKGMLEDVIKLSSNPPGFFFFDLCDPSKKTIEEIKEVLDLIGEFSSYGKVTLGVNVNETNRLWLAMNDHDPKDVSAHINIPPVKEAGEFVFKKMNIDTLLIHPVDRSLAITRGGTHELVGNVIQQPKVLTGGGDNLNAGYCLGLLAGFEIPFCLLLGMATSGAYVQNGQSPGRAELMNYIEQWAEKVG